MRRAPADAIQTAPELVLIAHVPAAAIAKAVPIELEPLDAFSEPEPSTGATIELASGRLVVVIYGAVTERISLHAAGADADDAVDDFLQESGIAAEAVEWRRRHLAETVSGPSRARS
jgi:hypothetical protein